MKTFLSAIFLIILLQQSIFSQPEFYKDTYLFQVGSVRLGMDNRGYLGRQAIDSMSTLISGKQYLFSSGFLLGGKFQNQGWYNGSSGYSLFSDYFPGKVGSDPLSQNNKIYVVRNFDFDQSWETWKEAVKLGASFYDGDNDGIYNPRDKNLNGKWDLNEDKPDVVGNKTAWCVYNDGVPKNLRRVEHDPMGIEIQQSVYAFEYYENIPTTIFIRYRIINTGKVVDVLEDMKFMTAFDPDLDDIWDDFMGSAKDLNASFVYNDSNKTDMAFMLSVIQPPYSFIPGVSFEDSNGNGIFDEGETALDNAYLSKTVNGTEVIKGATNKDLLGIFDGEFKKGPLTDYTFADIVFYNDTEFHDLLDPCGEYMGKVFGEFCGNVDPYFMYSGDPLNKTGWINTYPTDKRIYNLTKPFRLEKGKPQDIYIALIPQIGDANSRAITKAKHSADYAMRFHQQVNYNLVTSVEDEIINPVEFKLDQNYPNPFNPSTAINYQLSGQSKVELKIFDVLGREVQTLVNEIQNAGSYKVNFDASNLPSGIYIYQIKADNFIQSKKMILMK